MNRVQTEWKSFEKLLPINAPAIQRNDMRVAFFAGATSLFNMLVNGVDMSDTKEPTEKDMTMMNEIKEELKMFLASIEVRKLS